MFCLTGEYLQRNIIAAENISFKNSELCAVYLYLEIQTWKHFQIKGIFENKGTSEGFVTFCYRETLLNESLIIHADLGFFRLCVFAFLYCIQIPFVELGGK